MKTQMALSGAKPEFDPLAGEARARILLVDAHTKVHETVSEVLNSISCELVVLESPGKFEEVFFEKSPTEAVIIDLIQPVERSFELLSFVKLQSPKTKVIIVSRLAEVELWLEFVQRGACDYLAKPRDKSELQRIVMSALRKNKSV